MDDCGPSRTACDTLCVQAVRSRCGTDVVGWLPFQSASSCTVGTRSSREHATRNNHNCLVDDVVAAPAADDDDSGGSHPRLLSPPKPLATKIVNVHLYCAASRI